MSEPEITRHGVVFLLPGLGANADLFSDDPWPFPTRAVGYSAPSSPDMGFSEYALQLIAENDIRAGDSLIGVSLGGMLAFEIARHLPIRKLTLISSCTDSRQIQPCIRRLRPLSRLIPWRLVQRAPFPSWILSESRRRGLAMFRVADTEFLPWACIHAAVWRCPADHPDVMQIHGDRDPVFPISRQVVHHTVHGGDHLMVLSHWREIRPLLIARHGPERT
jgi:pimeloyl-ACP methyl ester carboxylesterase